MASDDPEDFDALFDRAFTPAGIPAAVPPRPGTPSGVTPLPPPSPAETGPINRFIAAPPARERRALDATGPISRVETITVGILLTDTGSIVRSANAVAARLFGGSEPLQGRPVLELFPEGDHPAIRALLEEVRSGRTPGEIDLTIPSARGALSIRLSVKGRLDDDRTTLKEVLWTLREVTGDPGLDVRIRTAKVDALAELGLELGREMGPIVSRVTETLRAAQRMLEPSPSGVTEQERDVLRATISEATAGLLKIQEGFAELDRFAFDLPMKVEPVDPAAVFGRAESLLARSLKARRVKVRNEMDEPAPRVLADASRLTEIFVNLLRNARNAIVKRFDSADETAPGSVRRLVVVETFVKGPYVCVTLTNNGLPIPAAEQERVFLPNVARDRRSGFGLPETAALMREMGGAIQCQAVEDQGTRFLLTFRKAE